MGDLIHEGSNEKQPSAAQFVKILFGGGVFYLLRIKTQTIVRNLNTDMVVRKFSFDSNTSMTKRRNVFSHPNQLVVAVFVFAFSQTGIDLKVSMMHCVDERFVHRHSDLQSIPI